MSVSPPAGTVTVRFSKAMSPRSGHRLMSAGAPICEARLPHEVETVVVERQRGDRRGVPPVEIEQLPAGVQRGRLEVAAVTDEIALHVADAAGAEGVGHLPEAGERIAVAGAGDKRVDRVASPAEGRIPPTVQHQIALQHPRDDRACRVETGAHGEVRRQQCGADRRDDELRIARGGKEPVLVAAVERLAVLVDAPRRPRGSCRRAGRRAACRGAWGGTGRGGRTVRRTGRRTARRAR